MKCFYGILCSLLVFAGCATFDAIVEETLDTFPIIIVETPTPTVTPRPTATAETLLSPFLAWLSQEFGVTTADYQTNVRIQGVTVDVYFPHTQYALFLRTMGDSTEDIPFPVMAAGSVTVVVLYTHQLTQIYEKTPITVYEGYWRPLFEKMTRKAGDKGCQ